MKSVKPVRKMLHKHIGIQLKKPFAEGYSDRNYSFIAELNSDYELDDKVIVNTKYGLTVGRVSEFFGVISDSEISKLGYELQPIISTVKSDRYSALIR